MEAEESYFGKINITSIANHQAYNDKTTPDPELTFKFLKYVHYSESQQLIIWLPDNGDLYNEISLFDFDNGALLWQTNISQILNGSIQLILYTLPIAPGKYKYRITKSTGTSHEIFFEKFERGIDVPEPGKPINIAGDADTPSNSIQYRDGFGNLMPDEDMILREKVLKKMADKFNRKLVYRDSGRSSKITYSEGDRQITFHSEMGILPCLFYIDIPPASDWVINTGFTLEERAVVLEFLATTTLRDQTTSDCRYEITDNYIAFYKIK
ncbi:MAG: hypothetical protein IPN29_08875 [Saprospiraceae bacterium]|nr:hypothetical protein [Saprospiraceae bacterium]